MNPTAKGQRPESIDISANVYSAGSLLIHTLCLEVVSEYSEVLITPNFLARLHQESTWTNSQSETTKINRQDP
jgi:hypothetical protein